MKEAGNIVFQILGVIVDIAIVGTLWVVCSLGIITFGAASTAAYYCMTKCVRYKESYIFREFFKCFKANFKQSTALTGILLGMVLLLAVDFYFIYCNFNSFTVMIGMLLLVVTLFIAQMTSFMFPLVSRFDNKTGFTIKISAALVMRYLPIAILFMTIFAAGILAITYFPPVIVLVPGVYMYFKTFLMEWIMRKFMPKVDADSPEADEWYNRKK